jgi:hypothetical protein
MNALKPKVTGTYFHTNGECIKLGNIIEKNNGNKDTVWFISR